MTGADDILARVATPGDPALDIDVDGLTRLEDWRDRAVPLRLCGAPGKAFTLIEDRTTFLPLPRRPFPEGDPDGSETD